MQEEITVRQDALDRQDKEIEDLHKKLDEQFDKVKLEMVTIQDKYKTDFDTDRDKYNQVSWFYVVFFTISRFADFNGMQDENHLWIRLQSQLIPNTTHFILLLDDR